MKKFSECSDWESYVLPNWWHLLQITYLVDEKVRVSTGRVTLEGDKVDVSVGAETYEGEPIVLVVAVAYDVCKSVDVPCTMLLLVEKTVLTCVVVSEYVVGLVVTYAERLLDLPCFYRESLRTYC